MFIVLNLVFSRSEIFCLKAVIVACSLSACRYVLDFQDQKTLPKWNILSQSCYCGLFSLCLYAWIGLPRPAYLPKVKYSLSAHIWAREQAMYWIWSERIFHFRIVCWSWKTNTHIQAKRTSHNNSFETKYFTLGGCTGLERHTSRENKQLNRVFITFSLLGDSTAPISLTKLISVALH